MKQVITGFQEVQDRERLMIEGGYGQVASPRRKTFGYGAAQVVAGVASIKAGSAAAVASGGVASAASAAMVVGGVKAIGTGIADISSGMSGGSSTVPTAVNALPF